MFELIYEDGRNSIRTGEREREISANSLNTRRKMKHRKERDQTKIQTNEKSGWQRGIHDIGRKQSILSTAAACDENPICHAELRSFIGYESFRRPSAPQAKVNTHRGERATKHRYAKN